MKIDMGMIGSSAAACGPIAADAEARGFDGVWASESVTDAFLQSQAALLTTDLLGTMSDIAADTLGAAHVADTGEWGTYAWSELTLGLPGLRVGGGTDEILKNAVGERVLRLPKDAR